MFLPFSAISVGIINFSLAVLRISVLYPGISRCLLVLLPPEARTISTNFWLILLVVSYNSSVFKLPLTTSISGPALSGLEYPFAGPFTQMPSFRRSPSSSLAPSNIRWSE